MSRSLPEQPYLVKYVVTLDRDVAGELVPRVPDAVQRVVLPEWGAALMQLHLDPATYPRRYVNLTLAAAYLEVNRRTLNGWIDEGKIPWAVAGKNRKKILLADLVRFDDSRRQASA